MSTIILGFLNGIIVFICALLIAAVVVVVVVVVVVTVEYEIKGVLPPYAFYSHMEDAYLLGRSIHE